MDLMFSRSIIFTNGTDDARLAAMSKEREQTRSKNTIVTTQIQALETFYPAEPEHQVLCFSIISNFIFKMLLLIVNQAIDCLGNVI